MTFSGDKLLGGPQSGLIAGTRRSVDLIKENPLHRAVRCDKMTLAALEATLRIYQQSPDLTHDIPTLRFFTRPIDDIAAVAHDARAMIEQSLGSGVRVTVEDGASQVGSGALPVDSLPTKVVVIVSDSMSADQLALHFRTARPAIIGRIKDDRFLLDAAHDLRSPRPGSPALTPCTGSSARPATSITARRA